MDWTSSMDQTFEYYIVDPNTWKDKQLLDNVISSTIDRDLNSATLYSAQIELSSELEECYIRIYLVAAQNGITERFPLGTFLVQTPSVSFDGKVLKNSANAYSPLLELKDKLPPLGYTIMKNVNIMSTIKKLCYDGIRAPVIPVSCSTTMYDNFTANLNDTWLSFMADAMAYAKYRFYLDELGQVLFEPIQETAALQPVWTFNDDNSSILYPDISVERDLYGIPNVVEVIYSVTNSQGFGEPYVSRIVNKDPNSPISTVSRGREVIHRVTNPSFAGEMSKSQIDAYAKQLLKQLSTLEYKATYKHGYCPVRIGDCVYLNYSRANLKNVKAVVISQSIDCKSGCEVSETAVYTKSLWGG